MKSFPLENYSSLHEFSLPELMGLQLSWPKPIIRVQYSFNLHTPLIVHPQTDILVHASQAEAQPALPNRNYSINGLNRWHLAISSYRSIEECITCMERWHRWNYKKSKQKFDAHGCTIKIIQNDWSEHAQTVNRLYLNVAQHYHHWIYDQHFFNEAAKRSDYSLLTAWRNKEMIGVFVLQEESSILHSTCCGLNYEHSTPSYAYSWMHYAFIDHAISQRKFNMVNVGMSADKAKREIGFTPVPSRLDIYAKGTLSRAFLNFLSRFTTATLNSDEELKLKWHL
jgi:predicted N-acyltransferase